MHLAHAHMLVGHVGAHNKLEKIHDHFNWSEMIMEVKSGGLPCTSSACTTYPLAHDWGPF